MMRLLVIALIGLVSGSHNYSVDMVLATNNTWSTMSQLRYMRVDDVSLNVSFWNQIRGVNGDARWRGCKLIGGGRQLKPVRDVLRCGEYQQFRFVLGITDEGMTNSAYCWYDVGSAVVEFGFFQSDTLISCGMRILNGSNSWQGSVTRVEMGWCDFIVWGEIVDAQ